MINFECWTVGVSEVMADCEQNHGCFMVFQDRRPTHAHPWLGWFFGVPTWFRTPPNNVLHQWRTSWHPKQSGHLKSPRRSRALSHLTTSAASPQIQEIDRKFLAKIPMVGLQWTSWWILHKQRISLSQSFRIHSGSNVWQKRRIHGHPSICQYLLIF